MSHRNQTCKRRKCNKGESVTRRFDSLESDEGPSLLQMNRVSEAESKAQEKLIGTQKSCLKRTEK